MDVIAKFICESKTVTLFDYVSIQRSHYLFYQLRERENHWIILALWYQFSCSEPKLAPLSGLGQHINCSRVRRFATGTGRVNQYVGVDQYVGVFAGSPEGKYTFQSCDD